MEKQSKANNVGETRALILRLYKKFPHLFKKTINAHNHKTFSLSLSATRAEVEDAFRMLKLSDDVTDLVGFKKLCCSLNRVVKEETAMKPTVNESLFPFKNEIVDHQKAEEIVMEPSAVGAVYSDYKESVRFDFGDDYGNRREFAELEKELVFGYKWCLRVKRGACKDVKYRAKDIYIFSSQEEMLKEFAKNNLL